MIAATAPIGPPPAITAVRIDMTGWTLRKPVMVVITLSPAMTFDGLKSLDLAFAGFQLSQEWSTYVADELLRELYAKRTCSADVALVV